jgi:DNA (cytosine-5)-methyltransferase 1
MSEFRFGSVCSGIEAASVAWHPLGWKAAWLSEIEPFPSAVLAHHYPDVPNLGDMTTLPDRILSGEVEAPDLFCGGTPCQAFSVAGLRNSLDDARGNLSLTFVGIANAIDHVRSVRSAPPAIIFWENVPGVLSTKDNAFGCFLGALAGEDDPIIPSGEKWTNAGCVYGPQRTVAWRVLDAQYFGVAQRRRRVFVVASARNDFDPAAVLFEFDGVRRDSAPSRETGKAIASCVTNGPSFSRTGNERVEAEAMVVAARKVALGEYLDDGIASTMKARDYKEATDLVAQTFSIPAIGHIVKDDVASTMTRHTGSGSGETQNPAFVAQPIPLNSMNVLRSADADPTTGCGIGEAGEAMFTLTKGNHHAVVQPISIQDVRPVEKAQNGKGWNNDGTAYTVDTHATQGVAQPIAYRVHGEHSTAMTGNGVARVADPVNITRCLDSSGGYATNQGGNLVAQPVAFAQNQRDEVRIMQVAGALAAEPGMKQQTYLAQTYIGGVDYENNAHTMDQPTGPLLKGSPTGGGRPLPAIATAMQVRRLTPVECERLQGFPDGYTNIPWRKKPEAPDGPRYKALGNSWAVPNVRWIGKRIQEALNDL